MSYWRTSKEYRLWRASVIRRDIRCKICNSLQDREAHHLNHAIYFAGMRFDVDNGVTLCKKCHTQYHTNYHNSFREKCEKKDFENFMSLVKYIKGLK